MSTSNFCCGHLMLCCKKKSFMIHELNLEWRTTNSWEREKRWQRIMTEWKETDCKHESSCILFEAVDAPRLNRNVLYFVPTSPMLHFLFIHPKLCLHQVFCFLSFSRYYYITPEMYRHSSTTEHKACLTPQNLIFTVYNSSFFFQCEPTLFHTYVWTLWIIS